MRLFKQLVAVFAVLGVLIGVLMIFAYDVIKIDWVVFMEIQDSYGVQEYDMRTEAGPRPVPAQSIPVEGPAYIPGEGAPTNPVPADEISIARGAQLFSIHCQMCHGETGEGNGTISAFLIKKKPADLTSELVQTKSDHGVSAGVPKQEAFQAVQSQIGEEQTAIRPFAISQRPNQSKNRRIDDDLIDWHGRVIHT